MIQLAGFSALVASFPADKRPSFIDSHSYVQRFPFAAFAHKHHNTYPDLAVSFPGQILDAETHPPFFDLAMIMEAKSKRNDDPFKKRGVKHCKTLVQLAVNARNLMHAHGLSCVFVFGIYGNHLRICRFDHSGAVVSQPIDLKDAEGVKVVQQFFWHFVHPTEDVPFVGWDPTVRKLTAVDWAWLKARLQHANFKFNAKSATAFTEARRAEVYDDNPPGGAAEPRAYILFKAIDVNGRLFSRATTVWLGIRDTRRLVNGRLIDLPAGDIPSEDLKLRVIKDTLRQLDRRPEKDFYERLARIPLRDRVGLPSLVCGVDLGKREIRRWEAGLCGAPTLPASSDHRARLLAPGPASSSSDASTQIRLTSLSAVPKDANLPQHRPLQQTFTWRQERGPEHWHRERSHVRLVVDKVGRPLSQFRTTRELVTAVRDAIRGAIIIIILTHP